MQRDTFGNNFYGKLTLAFPGRARLDYKDPALLILLYDRVLTYYDYSLQEATSIILSKKDPLLDFLKSPASISKENFTESEKFFCLSYFYKDRSYVLQLTKDPIAIFLLKIEESSGNTTTLIFKDVVYNQNIDQKVFKEF